MASKKLPSSSGYFNADMLKILERGEKKTSKKSTKTTKKTTNKKK